MIMKSFLQQSVKREMKASADNICESVENDGVYYEMERLGLFECLD